jgi:predicted secreted protein
MRRNVVQAASARLVASLGVLALTSPALAGDAANFLPLGFSADGRYFAYEEFGVQDGSGFPFSNVFILDVAEDKWSGGSPFRVRIEEEQPGLVQVREQSHEKAAQALADLAITEPPVIVALNGDAEPVEDRRALSFGAPGFGLEPPTDISTLTLSTFPSTSTLPCVESYGFDAPVGFALELKTGDGVRELHRDKTVPASRSCTVDYRLHGVVAPVNWAWRNFTPVAIVSVYSHGFEGPDRRFIAVPVTASP